MKINKSQHCPKFDFDAKKHLNETRTQSEQRDKMTESLEELQEYTSGLTFEVFIDVMVTSEKITNAYRKIFPDAPIDQTYEEMWKNIKQMCTEPEQKENE